MISDSQLNSLAIFLGTVMMGLIVLYHFLAVNSKEGAAAAAAVKNAGAVAHKAGVVGTK